MAGRPSMAGPAVKPGAWSARAAGALRLNTIAVTRAAARLATRQRPMMVFMMLPRAIVGRSVSVINPFSNHFSASLAGQDDVDRTRAHGDAAISAASSASG